MRLWTLRLFLTSQNRLIYQKDNAGRVNPQISELQVFSLFFLPKLNKICYSHIVRIGKGDYMKILVIGGTRFIGKHVIPCLLAHGHDVTLFNRGRTPNPFADQMATIIGDRKIPGDLAAKTAGQHFDAVVDMIAYDRKDTEDAVRAFNGRTKHYLMVSTRSVYRKPVAAPIHESDLIEDNPEVKYGYNKAQAENDLLQAYAADQFPATILRLPAVYGEYDYQAREWYFIKRLLDGRQQMLLPDYGFGINHREYAGNIAEQIAFLLAKGEVTYGQVYNSGHKHFSYYRDLVQKAADFIGQPVTFFGLANADMPWGVPLANEGARIVTTGKLEALGWHEPYSVEVALQNIITYFKENPIDQWIMSERQGKDLFDYQLEDELIRTKAVPLK